MVIIYQFVPPSALDRSAMKLAAVDCAVVLASVGATVTLGMRITRQVGSTVELFAPQPTAATVASEDAPISSRRALKSPYL
jgi:hypothetical protein